MKESAWFLSALLLAAGAGWSGAAEEDELAPPRPRPNVEQLRERARTLSPEERQRWMREFRERQGLAGTNRLEGLRLREEFRKLPPAEREARIQEFRQRLGQSGPTFGVLTAEERETKRKQIKERVDKLVVELQAKQADGTMTEVERRRLERMEQMSKRLELGLVLGPPRPAPPGAPGAGKVNP